MKKVTDLSKRLIRLLKESGIDWPGGENNAYIQRLYPGYWQKTAGAWLFQIFPIDQCFRPPFIGSTYSVTELVKSGGLELLYQNWDIELLPKEVKP